MKRATGLVVAAAAILMAFTAAPALAQAPAAGPLQARTTTDSLGRTVTFYVSRPDKPAPILLLIQGSGCQPVLLGGDPTGGKGSALFSLLPTASEGRFTVVAVEKPNHNATMGGPCSATFNEDFTADSWREALTAALAAARKLPQADNRRTLVFGHSEGAVMAALLAGRDPTITDVVAVGMTGDNQLFDMVTLAYRKPGSTAIRLQAVEDAYATARDILADPDSATELAWGHPYKRWSSFFRYSVVEELLRSKARLYIAAGTEDGSVPILSSEFAIQRLVLAGRDVTVRRVADADHVLMTAEDQSWAGLDAEYARARAWFWKGAPKP